MWTPALRARFGRFMAIRHRSYGQQRAHYSATAAQSARSAYAADDGPSASRATPAVKTKPRKDKAGKAKKEKAEAVPAEPEIPYEPIQIRIAKGKEEIHGVMRKASRPDSSTPNGPGRADELLELDSSSAAGRARRNVLYCDRCDREMPPRGTILGMAAFCPTMWRKYMQLDDRPCSMWDNVQVKEREGAVENSVSLGASHSPGPDSERHLWSRMPVLSGRS